MEHELKTWSNVFQDVLTGTKTFEYRKNDRNFHAGDTLRLREWDPVMLNYSGQDTVVVVSYLVNGGQFGIPPDYCIMGIQGKKPVIPECTCNDIIDDPMTDPVVVIEESCPVHGPLLEEYRNTQGHME